MITILGEPLLARAVSSALPEIRNVTVLSEPVANAPDPDCPLFVLQLSSAHGQSPGARMEAFLQGREHVAVIPVVDRGSKAEHLLELGALGVTEVLEWPLHPSEGMRRILLDLWAASLSDSIRRRAVHMDDLCREVLAWATRYAMKGVAAADLCRAFDTAHRTLHRRCTDGSGLSPGRLLLLGRLMVACHRLRTAALSVERVALDVGFAGSAGLRRALSRHVGRTPTELRVESGIEIILDGLRPSGTVH